MKGASGQLAPPSLLVDTLPEASQADVHRTAVAGRDENDPVAPGELQRVVDPGREAVENLSNEDAGRLIQGGNNGEIDIPCHARFAPPLHGQAADNGIGSPSDWKN